MIKAKLLFLLLLAIIFTSCKKDYYCFCEDNGVDFVGVKIRDTRKKAARKCKEYEKLPGNKAPCEIYYDYNP